MAELVVLLDNRKEVITVRRSDAQVVSSKDAEHDDYLFLDLDDGMHVVGVRLVAANEMPPEFWFRHPDRGAVPVDILSKLDELIPQIYGH